MGALSPLNEVDNLFGWLACKRPHNTLNMITGRQKAVGYDMKVVSGYVFLRTYYQCIIKDKMYNNLLVPSREMLLNKNIFILVKKHAFILNHN